VGEVNVPVHVDANGYANVRVTDVGEIVRTLAQECESLSELVEHVENGMLAVQATVEDVERRWRCSFDAQNAVTEVRHDVYEL
jgi:hypothetical protein